MTLEQALNNIADSLTADGELLEDTKEYKMIRKGNIMEIKQSAKLVLNDEEKNKIKEVINILNPINEMDGDIELYNFDGEIICDVTDIQDTVTILEELARIYLK